MTRKNGTDALEQSETAKRVNLAEWRANRIHEMDLPSGLHVKVRDVTMTDLMMTGRLPETVLDLANETAKNGKEDFDLKVLAKNAGDFNSMLNVLVELCLVEPKIGEAPDDEHITLAELSANDKLEMFNYLNREAQAVRSFREG